MNPRSLPRRLGDAAAAPAMLLASFLLVVSSCPLHALPVGAQIAAGDVAIQRAGDAMTLTQASRYAIVNWQGFNVGAGEQLHVQQSGADAAMLARVVGSDPSQLQGAIRADGKLFLINPNGIVISAGATIDTAAFAASTLDVADVDFLAGGALTFKGASDAGIVNLGRITAREGNVLIFARAVQNAGAIAAPKGTAALGAGNEVYLASPHDESFVIKLNLPPPGEKAASPAAGSTQTGVDNSGAVAAAQAELKAAGGSIYDLAVNQRGLVQATGFERRGGRIVLTAAGGSVEVSGTLTARNADGSGGEILVGGDYRGGNAQVPNAARTTVTSAAVLDASATDATRVGGRVVVWADDATQFHGTVAARGAAGGFAEVSGKHLLDFEPQRAVDLAGGTLLLDPDALTIDTNTTSGVTTAGTTTITNSTGSLGSVLNSSTLEAQLANANVILDTSQSDGDITFNASVAWFSSKTLTVKSGNSIFLSANRFLLGDPASKIELYAGKKVDDPQTQGGDTSGSIQIDGAITTGTLTVGRNPDAAPVGITYPAGARSGNMDLNAQLIVDTLQLDVAANLGNLSVNFPGNSIGTLRTINSGGTVGTINVADNAGGLDVQLAAPGSVASLGVNVTTPGTLRLLAGNAISFPSATRDVVLASTGGDFVNQAGASALGANARFLVYSSSPGATTKGGLVGTDVFGANFGNTPPANFSGDIVSRFLFGAAAALPNLTYSANSNSRMYGDGNPALGFSVAGFVNGLANDVTGAPVLATSAGQSAGVGNYTISISQGTLASANYAFQFAPGTLSITPAPLTITLDSFSRLYGDINPRLGFSLSGLRNDDDASVVGNIRIDTTATAASGVGRYPITATLDGTSVNYTSTLVPGTLAITPAPLTITPTNATRLYGDGNPAFSPTFAGFRNGDTAMVVSGLQLSTSATAASPVGSYAINGAGASAANYAINYGSGALAVTPAPLTITASNATRIYGDANPAFNATFSGFRNGDSNSVVSGLKLSTPATTASSAGSYPIAASGATATNYTISYLPGTLTVDKAMLSVRPLDAARLYGDTNPAFTASISGFKNGDTASVISGLTLTTAATTASSAGTYPITAGGASATNYTFAYAPGILAVNKAPLTATVANASRVYGTEDPKFTLAAVTGLKNGDTASVIADLAFTGATFNTASVGDYKIGATGTAANYAITFVPGTLAVTKAPLTLRGNDHTVIYGDALPAFGYTLSGLMPWDSPSVVTGVQVAPLTLTGADAPGVYALPFASTGTARNYEITAINGSLTVTRRPLLITFDSVTSVAGAVPRTFTVHAPALIAGGPQFTVLGATDARSNSPAGDYTIRAAYVFAPGTTLASLNRYYAVDARTAKLTLTQPSVAPITLTQPYDTVLTIDGAYTPTNPAAIHLDSGSQVSTATLGAALTPTQFIAAVKDLGPGLKDAIAMLLDQQADALKGLPEEQLAMLRAVRDGSMSLAALYKLLESDPMARTALLPVVGGMMAQLVEDHQPLTPAQQLLVARISDRIVTVRKNTADEAKAAFDDWSAQVQANQKDGRGALAFDMQLMPDVVSDGRQHVLQDVLVGVGGVVVGAGVGGASAAAVTATAAAIFPHSVAYATSVGTAAAAETASATVATAAGPIAVAIGVIVIATVVAISEIKKSEQHKVDYQNTLDRAKVPLGRDLSGLDLKDDTNRADFMIGFLAAFGETFPAPSN